jgi:hypothetical protein
MGSGEWQHGAGRIVARRRLREIALVGRLV